MNDTELLSISRLKKYKKLLGKRYNTLLHAFTEFERNNGKCIVELGSTRSFVDAWRDGNKSTLLKYWKEHNPRYWDWGAGCFTRICAECLSHLDITFHTIDISADAIKISQAVTDRFKDKMRYHNASSEEFLAGYGGKIDLLYMDVDNDDEGGAHQNLKEARIVANQELISDKGTILIDDVNMPQGMVSKSKYSIPFLLDNGYYRMPFNDYQAVLHKKPAIKIPKIIHQTWKTSEVPDFLKFCCESWKTMNPDWQYKLWTDREMENFVKENYPQLYSIYIAYPHAIQRCGMFRWLVVHKMGGVYADIDIECLKPLNYLFSHYVKYGDFVIAPEPDSHVKNFYKRDRIICDAFFAAIPNHPMVTKIIDEMVKRSGSDHVNNTGPMVGTDCIENNEEGLDILDSKIIYPVVDVMQRALPKEDKLRDTQRLKKKEFYYETCAVHYWWHSHAPSPHILGSFKNLQPGGNSRFTWQRLLRKLCRIRVYLIAKICERSKTLLFILKNIPINDKISIIENFNMNLLPESLIAECDGIKYKLNLRDAVQSMIYFNILEENDLRYISKLVPKGGVCIDVGANVGLYALHFAKWAGKNGIVHAFEPDPNNLKQLKENARLNGVADILHIHDIALSNKNGMAPFYQTDPLNSGWGCLHRYDDIAISGVIDVKTATIDNFLHSEKIERVDFLKVDIEATEFEFLEGAKESLKNQVFKYILIEFNGIRLEERGKSFSDFLQLFSDNNYRPAALNMDYLEKLKDGTLPQNKVVCNFLFEPEVLNSAAD